MRRSTSMLIGILSIAALVGCGTDEKGSPDPPAPATVGAIRPCQLLPGTLTAGMGLDAGESKAHGHRRWCDYVATGPDGDILSLDIVVRESAEPNTIADAARLAEVRRRERVAEVTTSTVAGRAVHHARWTLKGGMPGMPAAPVCSYFLVIGPAASVEAEVILRKADRACEFADMVTRLARALPPAQPAQPPPTDDRPVDVFALEPCALVPAERRAALGVDGGTPRVTGEVRHCLFHTDKTGAGEVSSVGTGIWTTGAEALVSAGDNKPTTLAVRGRTVYEVRDRSSCSYWMEITRATSIKLEVYTVGSDVESACRVLADLAPAVEPLLPLVGV